MKSTEKDEPVARTNIERGESLVGIPAKSSAEHPSRGNRPNERHIILWVLLVRAASSDDERTDGTRNCTVDSFNACKARNRCSGDKDEG